MKFFLIFTGIFCLILAACSSAQEAESARKISGVLYPENYRTDFIHYATVDRADGTVRDLYISPSALENSDSSLPDKTVIVVEAYYAKRDENGNLIQDEQGHLIKDVPFKMIHVVEKRATWQASDFVSSARAGNWNFASFEIESGRPFDENLTDCFNCHHPTPATDFIYTLPLLARFNGEAEYFYCDLPDRLAC